MADKFFQDDTPHGLVKRIMYKKYLQAFVPITQYFGFNTVIIDGFAGTGRYGEEWPREIEKYGSPLIALMVSLNFFYKKQHGKDKTSFGPETEKDVEKADLVAAMTRSDTDNRNPHQLPIVTQDRPKIELYFVESDVNIFRHLNKNIIEVFDHFFLNPEKCYRKSNENYKGFPAVSIHVSDPHYPIACTMINSKFTDFTPPHVIGSKCFVFLDPFGYSHMPMSHVEKFVRPGVSVLITFMSSYVNRFLSKYPDKIKDLYGKEYLIEKMRRRDLNTYMTYLLRGFTSCDGRPLHNIESCAANYEECLKRAFNCELSLTFEIRGSNNCIIYHLIFITSHMKSLEVMKESMNRCSQVENGFAMSDYTVYRNGSKLNLANTQDVNVVADAIYAHFEGKTHVSISEVKNYVLLNTRYLFRKKPMAVMTKGDDPRITAVYDPYDSSRKPPHRKGTFPDHTTWYLDFR